MPFFSFWWKVVRRAADKAWGHFNFLLGLVAIGSGVSVIGFFVQLAKKEGVDVNYWLLLIPVVLFGGLFLWRLVTTPFEIYQENQAVIKNQKEKIEKIESEKIELKPEFISLEPTD